MCTRVRGNREPRVTEVTNSGAAEKTGDTLSVRMTTDLVYLLSGNVFSAAP